MSITEMLLGGVALLFAVLFAVAMRLYASEIKEKKRIFQDIISNEGDKLRIQNAILESLKDLRNDVQRTNNSFRDGLEDIRDRLRDQRS